MALKIIQDHFQSLNSTYWSFPVKIVIEVYELYQGFIKEIIYFVTYILYARNLNK